MKTKISFVTTVVAALALTGCVHTRTVHPGDQATLSFAGINTLGARRTATVLLADGRAFKARSLQVAGDSTSWFYAGTDHFDTIATAEIHEVRFVRRGQGALEGFFLGLGGGAATGALLGLIDGDDPSCDEFLCWRFTAEEKAIVLGGVLGGIGALTGPFVGAGKGSRVIYRFSGSAPVPPAIAKGLQASRPSP